MPGAIATLSIKVLADLAELANNFEQAHQESLKFAKNVESAFASVRESITSSLANIAAAIGLAFSVEKLVEFGKSAVEQSEHIKNLAQSLGIATQSMQALGFAVAISGGNLDIITSSLEKLERSAVLAQGGNQRMQSGFVALGISVTDASGKLKSADVLFSETTAALSGMADGPQKVALAMQLMGRGAAENIPFLNAYGQNMQALREDAQRLDVVLSTMDQTTLLHFKESTNLLGQEVVGLGNEFMVSLAPALTDITTRLNMFLDSDRARGWAQSMGSAIGSIVDWWDQLSLKITAMYGAIDQLASAWETGWQIMLLGLKFKWDEFSAGIKNSVVEFSANVAKTMAGGLAGAVFGDQIDKAAKSAAAAYPDIDKYTASVEALRVKYAAGTAAIIDNVTHAGLDIKAKKETVAAVEQINLVMAIYHDQLATGKDKAGAEMTALSQLDGIEKALNATGENATYIQKALGKATDDVTSAYDRSVAPASNWAGGIGKVKVAAEDGQRAMEALEKVVDALTIKASDPYEKAWVAYEDEMRKVIDAVNRAKAAHQDLATIQALEDAGFAAAALHLDQLLQKTDEAADATTKINDAFNKQLDSIKGASLAQEKEKQELIELAIAQKAWTASHADGIPMDAEYTQGIRNMADAHVLLLNAAKADAVALQQWQGIAASGLDSIGKSLADFVTSGTGTWKSFGASLVADTRQFIAQIIQELLKLEVFNGLINSLFGSNLPTGVGGLFGQLLGGGSALAGGASSASIASNIGSGLSSGVVGEYGGSSILGQSANSAMSGATSSVNAISTSNGIMGWLFGSSSTAANVGAYSWAGGGTGSAYFMGPGADEAGSFMGPPSELSGGASGGAMSTIGPALTIVGAGLAGLNAYNAAGGGVSGLAAGATYAIGTYMAATYGLAAVSTAVTVGMASGVSAGMAAGFAAIPVVGWIALGLMAVNMLTHGGLFGTSATPFASTETVTVGQSGASILDTEVLKGKKPLFGGSYYDTKTIPTPDAQSTAMTGAFNSMESSIAAGAAMLGVTAGPIIEGSFREVWDKAGKMTSQESTVLGVKTSEDITAFWNRVTADNLLALLPASQNVMAIASRWQSSAATLLAGSQILVAAQVDINRGMGLLGSSDSSLADIAGIVQTLAQSGESMIATYGRLQGEQADLTGTLIELGLTTGKTGVAFVTFADTLTKAAGGLQNLDKLWANYFKNFYSASERAAEQLTATTATAGAALSQIGEDPNVTMAQFRADFAKALPTLTAAQVAQWLTAADALAAVHAQMVSIADTLAANQQKYADFEVSTLGDSFVQSMVKVVESEKAQIDSANALAKAAGLSGASVSDLAYIMGSGSAALGAAIASLTTGIATDIQKIYAPKVTFAGDAVNFQAIAADAAARAQAAHADIVMTGYDLIKKLGDYAFASGTTVSATLKQFGLSPEQLAATLGTTPDKINQQIAAAAKSAASLTTLASQGDTQTGLLQDILAALQGKAMPFDITTLVAPGVSAAAPGAKPAPHQVAGPGTGGEVVQVAKRANDIATSSNDKLGQIVDVLKNFTRGGGIVQRNTRGRFDTPVFAR